MHDTATAALVIFAAALSLLVWLYLLLGRGGYWRTGKNLLRALGIAAPGVRRPQVIAVIPARDEAAVIGPAVKSLLSNAESPVGRVIVVDDASSDNTAGAAREAAGSIGQGQRLIVMPGKPLAPGWTGKLSALAQGVGYALQFAPDYLLLTDADIVHDCRELQALVSVADRGGYDLVSLMVRLHCRSVAEQMLIPAFVYFFLQLYPPDWIASSQRKTAGAAGGCMLIRPERLAKIGGLTAVRSEVIDDCSLARAVKRSGGKVWMKLAAEATSIRPYGGFLDIGQMIARTAFSQLQHSVWLLLATVAGLTLVYIVPVWAMATFGSGHAAATLGGMAWLLMSASYLPMVRFYRSPAWWCMALPAIALFYAGATVISALQYWRGKGGRWKGRTQDSRSPDE